MGPPLLLRSASARDLLSSDQRSHSRSSLRPVSSSRSLSRSSSVSSCLTSFRKESRSPLDFVPARHGDFLACSSDRRSSPVAASSQADSRGHSHPRMCQPWLSREDCSVSMSWRFPSLVAESSRLASGRSSSIRSRMSSRCGSRPPGNSRCHSCLWSRSTSRRADEDCQEEHLSMELVSKMLQKGALKLVDQPGYYSHVFLVQKAMRLAARN